MIPTCTCDSDLQMNLGCRRAGATADAAATGIRTQKCPPPHGDGHFRRSEHETHSYVASLIVAVALCAAMPSESEMTCTAFASSGVASRAMR